MSVRPGAAGLHTPAVPEQVETGAVPPHVHDETADVSGVLEPARARVYKMLSLTEEVVSP